MADRRYGRRVSDDLVGETVWDDVEPRSPTPGENALLDQLVSRVGNDELTEQARTSRITGMCRCGCSSVRLASTSTPVADAMTLRVTANRRRDYFAITGNA